MNYNEIVSYCQLMDCSLLSYLLIQLNKQIGLYNISGLYLGL